MTMMSTANLSDAQIRHDLLEAPSFASAGTASSYDGVPRIISATNVPKWLAAANGYLESLRHLAIDWDGEGSPAPQAKIIQSAIEFLAKCALPLGADAPQVEPTRVGGIMISWARGDHCLEVDFVTPDRVEFLYFNSRTQRPVQGTLYGDSPFSPDAPTFEELIRRYFAHQM